MKGLNSYESDDRMIEIDPINLNHTNIGSNYGYGTVKDQKGRFQQVFFTLRRHWKMILLINFLITGAAIVYVAQNPVFYKAESRVQVNAEIIPNVGTKAGSPVFVNNAGSDPVYFSTQLQTLEGTTLLRRVVKTLDLENNPGFLSGNIQKPTIWQNVLRFFGFSQPPAPTQVNLNIAKNKVLTIEKNTPPDSDAETEKFAPFVGQIRNDLIVSPVKDNRTASRETRLIEIEFKHRDPQIAAKVANTIADTYVLMNLEQKVESNENAGDFLQTRLSEVQTQIRRDEEKLFNYSRDNEILALDGSQNTVIQKLTDLNVKLGQAENERIVAEVAYRAALKNPDTAVINESKDPRTTQIESALLALNQRLKQLKTQYTEEWVEVIEVRRQIENLEKELLQSRTRANKVQSATLEQVYREAVSREKELRANFENQRNRVLDQNEAAINYRMIEQEIESNRKLLDSLLQKSKENDIILNGTPNNVFVADRALTPRSPIGSQATKDILIAFLGSLGFGIGLGFFRDWLSNTIRYTDDIEGKLKIPLLTTVPFESHRLTTKLLSVVSSSKALASPVRLSEPEVAEAFIKLRTHLLSNRHLRTILITSADSGEGKTTTALNLAKVFAKSESKVLLIDADLRMPRIHSLTGFPNSEGLADLLIDEDANVNETVKKTEDGNLHILTAGIAISNPADLLSGNRMRNLLQELQRDYSYIIIDSPPVLLFADSIILSKSSDSAVLIVRDGCSSYHTVKSALRTMASVDSGIVGIVLNGVSGKAPFRNLRKYYSDKQLAESYYTDGEATK